MTFLLDLDPLLILLHSQIEGEPEILLHTFNCVAHTNFSVYIFTNRVIRHFRDVPNVILCVGFISLRDEMLADSRQFTLLHSQEYLFVCFARWSCSPLRFASYHRFPKRRSERSVSEEQKIQVPVLVFSLLYTKKIFYLLTNASTSIYPC